VGWTRRPRSAQLGNDLCIAGGSFLGTVATKKAKRVVPIIPWRFWVVTIVIFGYSLAVEKIYRHTFQIGIEVCGQFTRGSRRIISWVVDRVSFELGDLILQAAVIMSEGFIPALSQGVPELVDPVNQMS
jgi:hypothetical protein